jgi:hypothetical protein
MSQLFNKCIKPSVDTSLFTGLFGRSDAFRCLGATSQASVRTVINTSLEVLSAFRRRRESRNAARNV